MNKLLYISVFLISGLANAHENEYKGLYYYGAEVDSFKPCNSPDSFWVSHGWGSINSDLRGFYKRSTNEPYQAIYIEFIGHPHNEESGGFAKSYTGTLHISKITKLMASPSRECK
jgi:putative lipoprotein